MALDPSTKYIYSFKVVRKKDFNTQTVVKFLKPIVDEHNIKVMSADGAKINKKVAEELNLELDLCYFHEMANFMKLIRGPIRGLNQKIESEEKNIEEKILESGAASRCKVQDLSTAQRCLASEQSLDDVTESFR